MLRYFRHSHGWLSSKQVCGLLPSSLPALWQRYSYQDAAIGLNDNPKSLMHGSIECKCHSFPHSTDASVIRSSSLKMSKREKPLGKAKRTQLPITSTFTARQAHCNYSTISHLSRLTIWLNWLGIEWWLVRLLLEEQGHVHVFFSRVHPPHHC